MQDNVVIVTGAGNGIGRATAYKFASMGYHVVIADINQTDGEETLRIINKFNNTLIINLGVLQLLTIIIN